MTARELIKKLEKMNPESTVWFRDGNKLKGISIVAPNPHSDGWTELTNEECRPKTKRR